MTRRATFTEAELKRAIRAADGCGKVAVQTPLGIAFVAPEHMQHTAPEESDVDKWFRAHGDDSNQRH